MPVGSEQASATRAGILISSFSHYSFQAEKLHSYCIQHTGQSDQGIIIVVEFASAYGGGGGREGLLYGCCLLAIAHHPPARQLG